MIDPECPNSPQPVQDQKEDPSTSLRPTGDRMDESPDDALLVPPPSTPEGGAPTLDLTTLRPLPHGKEIAAPLPQSQAQLSRWAEDSPSSPTPYD